MSSWALDDGLIGDPVVALVGVANLAQPTQARVECSTPQDGVDASGFKILAVKVSSFG